MMSHHKLIILMLSLTLSGQGRIVGGREVAAHSRPYMVLIEYQLEDGNFTRCGGFILSEDFVMTAAHCQAVSYKVYLGFTSFSNNQIPIEVAQAFPHKDYNANDLTNDLMLLKLSSKAKFSKNVQPIALASGRGSSLPKSCSVSGWGKTSWQAANVSTVLMEVNVTLTEQCRKEKSYCSEGLKGPAEGDSGGPLVCEDGTAYGVVSSAEQTSPNEMIYFYYFYAKIPDYRDWIKMIMKDH